MSSDDLLAEFLCEAIENLEVFETALLGLEAHPTNREHLSEAFRAVHTVKGTSSFFGLDRIGSVTHAGESLLADARAGALVLGPEHISRLLSLSDCVRRQVASLERGEGEGGDDHIALEEQLHALRTGPAAAPHIPPLDGPGNEPEAPAAPPPDTAATPAPALPHEKPQAVEPSQPEPRDAASPGVAKVRVDVNILDEIMNLVGELVLTRGQIVAQVPNRSNPLLYDAVGQLVRVTSALQESVLQTRMHTIGSVWDRFPRVMRDMATATGKEAELVLQGGETELDRRLLEAITDPLTHLVRNAVDHGIEAPEIRLAAGKPRTGRVTLAAFHVGREVVIEVRDDGAGIDVEKLCARAIADGILTAEAAAGQSHRELLGLVFHPGLTTAAVVTSLSGRGVGMDVVRNRIERIGGSIELRSTPGAGTTTRLCIPLTLAIVTALIVRCRGERFAIPLTAVRELVRSDGSEARGSIERIDNAAVHRLRGSLLPLLGLADALGLDAEPDALEPRPASQVTEIVVLQSGSTHLGLLVDEISDSQEVVVKPLGRHLRDLGHYSGATILGDGQAALILDVASLGASAGVATDEDSQGGRAAQDEAAGGAEGLRRDLVILESRRGARMTVPLDLIGRLEQIPVDDIEQTEQGMVMQYHQTILPLVDLDDALAQAQGGTTPPSFALPPSGSSIDALTYTDDGYPVGLLVHRIVDIVKEPLRIEEVDRRVGVCGTSVLSGCVTEVIDLPGLLRVMPRFLGRLTTASAS